MKPLGDRILIRKIEAKDKTKGGIILPDAAKEKPTMGTVLSVGAKVEDVKEGQTVIFFMFGGTEVNVNDETLYVYREAEILAIVEDSQ